MMDARYFNAEKFNIRTFGACFFNAQYFKVGR